MSTHKLARRQFLRSAATTALVATVARPALGSVPSAAPCKEPAVEPHKGLSVKEWDDKFFKEFILDNPFNKAFRDAMGVSDERIIAVKAETMRGKRANGKPV